MTNTGVRHHRLIPDTQVDQREETRGRNADEQRGNKALQELTREGAVAFADWEERVVTEGIGAGTANKNINHISGMIKAVDKLAAPARQCVRGHSD